MTHDERQRVERLIAECDDVLLHHALKQLLAAAEAGERIRAWANSETPKAHTYASENADLYRGWENGQNSAKQDVLALLPAERHAKET